MNPRLPGIDDITRAAGVIFTRVQRYFSVSGTRDVRAGDNQEHMTGFPLCLCRFHRLQPVISRLRMRGLLLTRRVPILFQKFLQTDERQSSAGLYPLRRQSRSDHRNENRQRSWASDPRDLAILGFDNIELSECIGLSAVDQFPEKSGRDAAELVMGYSKNRKNKPEAIYCK